MMKILGDAPKAEWKRDDWIIAGLILGSLLIAALLVIVPAFGAPEDTTPQCRITGWVYGTADPAESGALLAVPANCSIDVAHFERRLVLTSPRWRVEIEIPREEGWQRFSYTWGQDRAYIGAREVPIVASPREAPA